MISSRNFSVACALHAVLLLSFACEGERSRSAMRTSDQARSAAIRKTTPKQANMPMPVATHVTAKPSTTNEGRDAGGQPGTLTSRTEKSPTVLTSTSEAARMGGMTAPLKAEAEPALDSNAEITVDLRIGSDVIGRKPVEFEATIPGNDLVYAWTDIKGIDDGIIQHVWYRNGRELRRFELTVENARRWRTWSIVKVKSGQYSVKVLAPNGKKLAETSFEVQEPQLELQDLH